MFGLLDRIITPTRSGVTDLDLDSIQIALGATLSGSLPGIKGTLDLTGWVFADIDGILTLEGLEFTSIDLGPGGGGIESLRNIWIIDNPDLTSITFPASLVSGGAGILCGLDFSGNALTQTTVDAILAACVAGGSAAGIEVLDLTGGTNATPSAAGLADKATLQTAGWTVTNN